MHDYLTLPSVWSPLWVANAEYIQIMVQCTALG